MSRGKKSPPTALQKAVADILVGYKARRRVTNQQLAEATGIMSRSQVAAVLKGDKHVDIEQLDALCYALGLELTKVIQEAEAATDDRQRKPEWTARILPLAGS